MVSDPPGTAEGTLEACSMLSVPGGGPLWLLKGTDSAVLSEDLHRLYLPTAPGS